MSESENFESQVRLHFIALFELLCYQWFSPSKISAFGNHNPRAFRSLSQTIYDDHNQPFFRIFLWFTIPCINLLVANMMRIISALFLNKIRITMTVINRKSRVKLVNSNYTSVIRRWWASVIHYPEGKCAENFTKFLKTFSKVTIFHSGDPPNFLLFKMLVSAWLRPIFWKSRNPPLSLPSPQNQSQFSLKLAAACVVEKSSWNPHFPPLFSLLQDLPSTYLCLLHNNRGP